jgi:hypothetical protein
VELMPDDQTLDRYDQPLEEGNSCFVSVLPAPPG